MDSLTITKPDDWHLHLRDGALLRTVAPDSARRFARVLAMPNLDPPIRTVQQAEAYRERILRALPADPSFASFDPWISLYLHEDMPPSEIARARQSERVLGVKLYPAGVTTGAEAGVRDLRRVYPVLEQMERLDLPLQIHGEIDDAAVDIYRRETVFIERVLAPLLRDFPGLRVVLEHISTGAAAAFVREGPPRLAATITPQHLMLNRNALFQDGRLRPHHYCLPVLKSETDQRALIEAASGGCRRFFLGTDSAPHTRTNKECANGCAGVYSAHAAIEFYAEVFEQANRLERLESFCSFHGADFYQLPRSSAQLTLRRKSWQLPERLVAEVEQIVPLRAGTECRWQLSES